MPQKVAAWGVAVGVQARLPLPRLPVKNSDSSALRWGWFVVFLVSLTGDGLSFSPHVSVSRG